VFQQGTWDLRIGPGGLLPAERFSNFRLPRRVERLERSPGEGQATHRRLEAGPRRAAPLRGCDRHRLGPESCADQRSGRTKASETRAGRLRERMESGRELDTPGRTSGILFLILLLLCLCGVPLAAETAVERDARIKALVDQQRWSDVVREVERIPDRDADVDFYYGTALAQLNRWDDARHAFFAGRQLAPTDSRFPVELGGVAFKQKRYAEAAKWVRRGLQLNPTDAYGNDFLAT